MIIKGKSIAQAVSKPDPGWRAMLFYGPDEGLIREYAITAARTVAEDLNDAFRVVQLTGADLKSDPARLPDEAAAISMFGGRRVLRLTNIGDAQTDLLAGFLGAPVGDALIVIEAGELSKASKLRKLFEAASNAVIIACYSDSVVDLAATISQAVRSEGFTISKEALLFLSRNFTDNRMINRQELEKLFLYMGPGRGGEINLSDVQAITDDQGAQDLDEICNAFGGGDVTTLDRALARAQADNLAAVAIIRAAANYMLRLQQVAAQTAKGVSLDSAVSMLRPPVHFSQADRLRAQARRWSLARTSQALDVLLQAEIQCKTTGMPDQAICSRALMRLAQTASSR